MQKTHYQKQIESVPGEDSQTSIIELCVKCYKEPAKQRNDMNTNIKQIKESILPILQRYGVSKAGLFGSVVKDQIRPGSDVDILGRLLLNLLKTTT